MFEKPFINGMTPVCCFWLSESSLYELEKESEISAGVNQPKLHVNLQQEKRH
jgi:hypothetical protein